ncbi:tetratricopeptide repeat protein [Mesorhizobium sp. Cs1299R1N1]|uniref:tetratricopeptide repeat protein n=1 Tax=Mesorhizobium sp. Cs1299R1N1 TaxID=3015172 RepID=UPI00301BBF9B
MFGVKSESKIVGGDGNIQVSGNVEVLNVGVPFELHFEILKQRIDEVTGQQQKIQALGEKSLIAEKEILQRELSSNRSELDYLNEVLRDPIKYIDFVHGARLQLFELLSDLNAKELSIILGQVKASIASGDYVHAEKLLVDVEQGTKLSSRMESEVTSARAALSVLQFQLHKAETLFRRAFYLSPSVDGLISLLDHIDMSGRRQGVLTEFSAARSLLSPVERSEDSIRLILAEAFIRASVGELSEANILLKKASSDIVGNVECTELSRISLELIAGSIAAVEENQMVALRKFELALSMIEKSGNSHSLLILRVKANIGACLAELNRLPAAIEVTRKCVEDLRKMGNAGRYHLGIRLNNLGDFFVRNKQAREAIPILKESIEVALQILPKGHPSFIRRKSNLAAAYKMVGEINSSITILKDIDVDESMLGETDRRSLAKAMYELFSYSLELYNWYDALGAILKVRDIGAKYLRDSIKERNVPIIIEELQGRVIRSRIDIRL